MLAGVLILALAAPPGAGSEEEWADDRGLFVLDQSHAGFEVGFYTEEDLTSLSFLLDARAALTESFALEVAIPFAFAEGRGEASLQFGNITVGAFLRGLLGAHVVGEVGFEFGLPTAQIDESERDSLFAAAALGLAAAHRGFRDYGFWEVESLSMALPLRLEISTPSGFFVDTRLRFQAVIPTIDEFSSIGVIQSQLELGYRERLAEVGVGTGLWFAASDGDDDAQAHMQLRARLYFVRRDEGQAPFFQGRVVVNLDEPFGFGREGGAIFGTLFSLGIAWR